jgi:hypothetical protein
MDDARSTAERHEKMRNVPLFIIARFDKEETPMDTETAQVETPFSDVSEPADCLEAPLDTPGVSADDPDDQPAPQGTLLGTAVQTPIVLKGPSHASV